MSLEEELRYAGDLLDLYLKKHQLRNTKERVAMLKFIFHKECHFTVPQLHRELSQEFYISKSTVYNNIDLYVRAGLIVRHHFSSEAEYEKITRARNHFHRICIECGEVKEFTDKKLQKVLLSKSFSAFQNEFPSLYLYGHCKKCLKKAEELAEVEQHFCQCVKKRQEEEAKEKRRMKALGHKTTRG